MMRLVSKLNHPHIHVSDILSHATPASLGTFWMADWKREQTKEEKLVVLKEGNPDRPALFCIPPSGGMTMCYLDLLQVLDFDGMVYGMTDEKYVLFEKLSEETLMKYADGVPDSVAREWNHKSRTSLENCVIKRFRKGDYLMGYSQGGSFAHGLAGKLESAGKEPGGLIMLEAEPIVRQQIIRGEESLFELATAVCFGQREVESKKKSWDYNAEDNLKNRLSVWLDKKMVNDEREKMVHMFWETYLVLMYNMRYPVITEGKISAPIFAILLGNGTEEENPWGLFSEQPGESVRIVGDEDDHLVFLSKYREEISGLIEDFVRNCSK